MCRRWSFTAKTPRRAALMLNLNDFFYFVQVVDRGGFTAAGRTLRVPKSTLSHRMQELETNLGVRLLNRTSRCFGLTDAGEDFYRLRTIFLAGLSRSWGYASRADATK
jgi:DNA-binding transcriptional LysR family regulator